MARRRAITEELNTDDRFASLSLGAEHLWYRMLSVSDDFGIVPATAHWLNAKCNLKEKVKSDPILFLEEIVSTGLGILFEYAGKLFFAFKPESFERLQSQFVAKRTKSEYLRESADKVDELISEKFREIQEQLTNASQRTLKCKVLSIKRERASGKISEIPGNSGKPKREPSLFLELLSEAESQDTDFVRLWGEWAGARKKLTESIARARLEDCREMGIVRAKAALHHSIGYQGIFEKSQNGRVPTPPAEDKPVYFKAPAKQELSS